MHNLNLQFHLIYLIWQIFYICQSWPKELTWRKWEWASIWLHHQTPGGNSYWSPDWIRSYRCRDETLGHAQPLRGQIRRKQWVTWTQQINTWTLNESVFVVQILDCAARCDFSSWAAWQGLLLSCLQLWALCLCITLKHTPLDNPFASTQRQSVPLCAHNEKPLRLILAQRGLSIHCADEDGGKHIIISAKTTLCEQAADWKQIFKIHKHERAGCRNTASTDRTQHTYTHNYCMPPTKSGSVLADEPAVIDEERSEAHWEHGGREEEEQDVELRLSVWQAVLRRNPDVNTAAPAQSMNRTTMTWGSVGVVYWVLSNT